MEKRIYDKQTGIHYELQGDYYLPCLELPEQPKVEIGIWGCGSPVETSAAGRSTDRAGRRDRLTEPRYMVSSASLSPP